MMAERALGLSEPRAPHRIVLEERALPNVPAQNYQAPVPRLVHDGAFGGPAVRRRRRKSRAQAMSGIIRWRNSGRFDPAFDRTCNSAVRQPGRADVTVPVYPG